MGSYIRRNGALEENEGQTIPSAASDRGKNQSPNLVWSSVPVQSIQISFNVLDGVLMRSKHSLNANTVWNMTVHRYAHRSSCRNDRLIDLA